MKWFTYVSVGGAISYVEEPNRPPVRLLPPAIYWFFRNRSTVESIWRGQDQLEVQAVRRTRWSSLCHLHIWYAPCKPLSESRKCSCQAARRWTTRWYGTKDACNLKWTLRKHLKYWKQTFYCVFSIKQMRTESLMSFTYFFYSPKSRTSVIKSVEYLLGLIGSLKSSPRTALGANSGNVRL